MSTTREKKFPEKKAGDKNIKTFERVQKHRVTKIQQSYVTLMFHVMLLCHILLGEEVATIKVIVWGKKVMGISSLSVYITWHILQWESAHQN